jgi:hypothetical protein
MRNQRPTAAPPNTSASVSAKRTPSRAGKSGAAAVTAPGGTTKCATAEAITATSTTRRYCMKATRRASAPNSSAMTTIEVAAPGEDPQIAVVPGRMRQRANAHPSALLAASTPSVTSA